MDFGRCRIIVPWGNWENDIHADESQIDRQGRSMTYPFSFDIDEKNKIAHFSSTSELPFYDTSLSECTCGDFQARKLPCKHIYRLAVELGIIEIIKRAPGGYDKDAVSRIKESSDVDRRPRTTKAAKKRIRKEMHAHRNQL